MKKTAFKIFQLLLGAFMVIIGFNKFLMFIDIPQPDGAGGALMQIYIFSGFLNLIGILQILSGSALLVNRFVPLALTFITAIMFNATIFHVLHDLPGIGGAASCLLFCILLVYGRRAQFSELWKP